MSRRRIVISISGIPSAFARAQKPLRRRRLLSSAGALGALALALAVLAAPARGADDEESVKARVAALIKTLGEAQEGHLFNNGSLSIAVVAGDYVEIKIVCPAWATNPVNVKLGGVVYIE